jgi:preprotein translocase subunit SecG
VAIVIVLALVMIVLMLVGSGHGPGRHTGADATPSWPAGQAREALST